MIVLVLQSPPCRGLRLILIILPSRKMIIFSEILPFLSYWDERRMVTPLFYLWFLLVMAIQKIYIEEKKIWAVEFFFFFDMNDENFRINRAKEKYEIMLKLPVSLKFFRDRLI